MVVILIGGITAGQSTFAQVIDLRRIWFDPSTAHEHETAPDLRIRGQGPL